MAGVAGNGVVIAHELEKKNGGPSGDFVGRVARDEKGVARKTLIQQLRTRARKQG